MTRDATGHCEGGVEQQGQSDLPWSLGIGDLVNTDEQVGEVHPVIEKRSRGMVPQIRSVTRPTRPGAAGVLRH